MNVAFESSVEQRRLLPGSKLADDVVTALDIRETIASPETVLRSSTFLAPAVSLPQAVLDRTRQLFTGTVTRAVYVTPKAGEADAPALQLALAACRWRPMASAARCQRRSPLPTCRRWASRAGWPGSCQTGVRDRADRFGQRRQARCSGRCAMSRAARDGQGPLRRRLSRLRPGDAPLRDAGRAGAGRLGRARSGRRNSTASRPGASWASISRSRMPPFEFSAETRPGRPGRPALSVCRQACPAALGRAPFLLRSKAAAKLQYESYASSPQGVLERDLQFLQYGRRPRFRTPTPAEIDAATPQNFREVWAPILETGPVEVQILAISTRPARSRRCARPSARCPARAAAGRIRPAAPANRAAEAGHCADRADPSRRRGTGRRGCLLADRRRHGRQSANRASSRSSRSCSQNRLLDEVREKLGVSYAPLCLFDLAGRSPSGRGDHLAIAQFQPRTCRCSSRRRTKIAADLIAKPATADELGRVIEPLRQQLTRPRPAAPFSCGMLEGASRDPSRKFASIRTLLADYTQTTPEAEMQALPRAI
jgi:zinc protease